MASKFGQIRSGTTELAALEYLKKSMLPLFLVSQLWLYLGNSQASVYRTIGSLFFYRIVLITRNVNMTKATTNIMTIMILFMY